MKRYIRRLIGLILHFIRNNNKYLQIIYNKILYFYNIIKIIIYNIYGKSI